MTLVELLVAVVILGVITSVLGTTLYLGLRTTRDNRTALDQSNGEQLLATWLAKDVHEADTISVDDASAACGGPAPLKLRAPTDAMRSQPDTTTAYALAGGELVRRVCEAGAATPFEHSLAVGVVDLEVDAACASSATCTVTVTAAASSTEVGGEPYEYTIETRRRRP
jgi:type II secretory pathway pseudopilin PulG